MELSVSRFEGRERGTPVWLKALFVAIGAKLLLFAAFVVASVL